MESSKKVRVLIVDDNLEYLRILKMFLSQEFEVFSASNVREANSLMAPGKFDCVLIDVRLGDMSGIALARSYRAVDNNLGIILNTVDPDLYYENVDIVADAHLEKVHVDSSLPQVIRSLVWRKRMSAEARMKRFLALQELVQCYDAISFRKIAPDGSGAERMEGFLTRDKEPIAWVAYNDPSLSQERNVIALASSVGCIGGCKFCRSGTRSFKRSLSVEEMIAQFLYALESYHTVGAFEKPIDLTVNFTTEGDCVFSNMENSCEVVRILSGIKDLDLKFIITTMGHQKNLVRFLKNYISLPITFYWSLNFMPRIRGNLMPATRGQSVEKIRDVFQNISAQTGRTITVAWTLTKGLNDTLADVKYLKELFVGRPFEVKLTAMRTKRMLLPELQKDDLAIFAEKLKDAGVPFRLRNLVGFVNCTCGETTPTYPSFRKL